MDNENKMMSFLEVILDGYTHMAKKLEPIPDAIEVIRAKSEVLFAHWYRC